MSYLVANVLSYDVTQLCFDVLGLYILFVLGVLRPSQQCGHVEPVS